MSHDAGATVRLTPVQTRVLWTTSLVSSLIMLDSNIVAVSLPALGRSLGASFTEIEWVVSAYLVSYAALLLAAGAFADRYGRKRTMLIGLMIFAAASGACGAARSSLLLDIARAVQGLGGSLLLTAALAIITHDFVGAARARAFAIWGACLGVALTGGPIIGGAITNWFGWRWVFLVNVPVCAILIVATVLWIAESRDPDAKTLDVWGVVTFSPGLFFLVWALIDGNDAGWNSTVILVRLGAALLCFVAFGLAERLQRRPMIDFALFRSPTFRGAVIAMVGYGAAAQVMVFYLPLYLENAYAFAPAKAGLAMIPFAVPMVVVPRFVAMFSDRVSGRVALAAGLAVTALGNGLFWTMANAGLSYPTFALAMLVAGTGAGILNGETVKVLGEAVPPDRAGMASGLASTARFIGILFGVAGLGSVIATVARHRFVVAATTAGLGRDVAMHAATRVVSGDLAGMMQIVPSVLRSTLRSAGLTAFARGFGAAGLVAAVIAGVASALTFAFIRDTGAAPALAGTRAPAIPAPPTARHCLAIDCRHPI